MMMRFQNCLQYCLLTSRKYQYPAGARILLSSFYYHSAMHKDAHFGATKNGLLEATYHPDVGYKKIGLSIIFSHFVSLLDRLA